MLPKKTSSSSIILTLVLCALCGGQTPEQLSKDAAAALGRRQYFEAEKLYQKLAALLPGVPEIQSNLGLARYFQQDFPGAEAAFRSALSRNPNLFVPNFFLGRIYFMASRHNEALPLLERALESRQNEALVRQMLAAVFVGLNRIGDARAQYALLLNHNAADIDALYGLGRTYIHLGRKAYDELSKHKQSAFYVLAKAEFEATRPRRFRELAEKYFRQAIEISPDTPGLRVRFGSFLLTGANTKEAGTTLEDELKIDPYSYESRFLLSFARLLEGDTGAALRELNEAVRIRPEFFDPLPKSPLDTETLESGRKDLETRAAHGDPRAALFLSINSGDPKWHDAARRAVQNMQPENSRRQTGQERAAADSRSAAQALFRRKRYEEGIAVLEKAPKAAADLRMNLAWAYFYSNSFENVVRLLEDPPPANAQSAYVLGAAYKQLASQTLERLVTIAPESARAHALMGDSLYAREQYGEAVTEYTAALKAQPGDPELLFSLGNAHFKALEFEKAVDAYTKVLAANPWHSAASHLNGRSLLMLNRPEESLPFLRKAIELEPRFKEAHAALGQALATLGRNEEAIKHLDAGAASDTDGSVHFQLFQLYRKVGNIPKAEEARRRSLALRKTAEASDEPAR